jgi:hypothetical protein
LVLALIAFALFVSGIVADVLSTRDFQRLGFREKTDLFADAHGRVLWVRVFIAAGVGAALLAVALVLAQEQHVWIVAAALAALGVWRHAVALNNRRVVKRKLDALRKK